MKSYQKGSKIYRFNRSGTQNFLRRVTMVKDIFRLWATFQKIPSYASEVLIVFDMITLANCIILANEILTGKATEY